MFDGVSRMKDGIVMSGNRVDVMFCEFCLRFLGNYKDVLGLIMDIMKEKFGFKVFS